MDRRSRNMIELTIIVPVYNEARIINNSIPQIINEVQKICKKFEVIVVDDGSSDNTGKKLSKLGKKFKELIILEHKKNRGLGASIKTAAIKSRGKILITIDADLSYSPAQIPDLLSKIGSYDIVIGSPYCTGNMVKAPIIRKIASLVQNKMYATLLRTDISCVSGMFRAYKKEVLQCIDIEHQRYDSQIEIIVKALKKGYQIVEVPAVNNWPQNRESKVVLIREIPNSIRLLIKLMFNS